MNHPGKIIKFALGAGLIGQKTQTAYVAVKEAIRGMTRVVANGAEQWKAAFKRDPSFCLNNPDPL